MEGEQKGRWGRKRWNNAPGEDPNPEIKTVQCHAAVGDLELVLVGALALTLRLP